MVCVGMEGECLVSIVLTRFSCFCGFQCEGTGENPDCERCGGQMRAWGKREVTTRSNVLIGESADKRTENGGY